MQDVIKPNSQSNFEDFELEDKDFEEINKWGQANRTRANIPRLYKPKWVENPLYERH